LLEKIVDPGTDHNVLIYRDDDELTERVSEFLRAAIDKDGSAILISTPRHLDLVQARLASGGLDLLAAGVSGGYLALDASEIMHKFVVAGWPDPGSFWRAISPLVRQRAVAGRPVSVFGEIVALLWEAGLVSAAVEVETMWNELAAAYPFALLCGYSAASMTGEHHAAAVEQVLRLHRGYHCPGH
jgi:MEDS: MEthanogen/methylotroph, DcmR Sensory domain